MRIAVILAGGKGERMAAGRNKALLELAGKPILLYSVETLGRVCTKLVVVAAPADCDAIAELTPEVRVVEGGATRHGSERSALQALRAELQADDVVAIHDAARPLVAHSDAEAVFAAAEQHGAAMLAAGSDSPLLEVQADRVGRAYSPADIWRAQTPQAARAEWLLEAYDRAAKDGFDGTDTAAVLEHAGFSVRVLAATTPNPKITVPADLAEAERRLFPPG